MDFVFRMCLIDVRHARPKGASDRKRQRDAPLSMTHNGRLYNNGMGHAHRLSALRALYRGLGRGHACPKGAPFARSLPKLMRI